MSIADTFVNQHGQCVCVKRGFSWPAFLFGPFWAIFRRSWRTVLFMLAGYIPIIAIDEIYVGSSTSRPLLFLMLALYLGYMFVCGRYGNQWLAASLVKGGYFYSRSTNA